MSPVLVALDWDVGGARVAGGGVGVDGGVGSCHRRRRRRRPWPRVEPPDGGGGHIAEGGGPMALRGGIRRPGRRRGRRLPPSPPRPPRTVTMLSLVAGPVTPDADVDVGAGTGVGLAGGIAASGGRRRCRPSYPSRRRGRGRAPRRRAVVAGEAEEAQDGGRGVGDGPPRMAVLVAVGRGGGVAGGAGVAGAARGRHWADETAVEEALPVSPVLVALDWERASPGGARDGGGREGEGGRPAGTAVGVADGDTAAADWPSPVAVAAWWPACRRAPYRRRRR